MNYGNYVMAMVIALAGSLGILNQPRRMHSTNHGTDTMMTFANTSQVQS